jgi:hypothetical protein
LANLVPLSAPITSATNQEASISMVGLMNELRASMNEFELIMDKLLDPAWVSFFETLSPSEFGTVVSMVHEFDQARVAVVLAPHCNRGHGLTCEYIAAVLRVASPHHRAVTTQKLLPHCIDAKDNSDLILAELNGWEQTVTEQALQLAQRR